MNRELIKMLKKNLDRSVMHTPDGLYLIERLRNLTDAILEDEKTITGQRNEMIVIDLRAWSRIDEVRNYAKFHDLTEREAIERLVNSGLSHEHRGWLS